MLPSTPAGGSRFFERRLKYYATLDFPLTALIIVNVTLPIRGESPSGTAKASLRFRMLVLSIATSGEWRWAAKSRW
jgi:hypothetical protein